MPKLSEADIASLEASMGVHLPRLYRQLLTDIGYGPVGTDAEIYHPGKVHDLYEPFFDDPAQLFAPYFPFGCHNRKQELWIIDAARECAASIWHETVPDDWLGEQWMPYDKWVQVYLNPELHPPT